jgi:hypothetical protein
MAEYIATSTTTFVMGLITEFDTMSASDKVAKDLGKIVRSVAFALREAQDQGAFAAPDQIAQENLELVRVALCELLIWTDNYCAGSSGGRLERFLDVFTNLLQLRKLSQQLDRAQICFNSESSASSWIGRLAL